MLLIINIFIFVNKYKLLNILGIIFSIAGVAVTIVGIVKKEF